MSMKKILIILIVSILLFAFTSCKTKTECFWCGEEKYCEERDLFGETIYMCKDCLDEIEEEFAEE